MSSRRIRRVCLGWALWLAAGIAQAQGVDVEPAEPIENIAGDVAYVSGGIGADERAILSARARSYNLMMIFRLRNSSEALTDVAVKIATPRGDVLVDALSEGPMFLVRLPKGRYVVQVTLDNHALKREFVIGSSRKLRGHRFIFRWNASGSLRKSHRASWSPSEKPLASTRLL